MQENLQNLDGAVNFLSHQYQEFDSALAPLVQADVRGSIVQLQLNFDRAKAEVQQLVAEKMHELEEKLCDSPAPAQVKAARTAQKERIDNLTRRVDGLGNMYNGIAAMYNQICDMHDTMQRIIGLPIDQIKLGLQLVEKLQTLGKDFNGSLNEVTVVSLSDDQVTPQTPERSEA